MRPRVGVSQGPGRDEGLGLAPALSRAFGSVIWVAFVSYSLLPLLATVLFSVSEGWVNTVFPERLSVASYAALFREPLFLVSLGRSVLLALGTLLIVTVLCVLLVTWIHFGHQSWPPPRR